MSDHRLIDGLRRRLHTGPTLLLGLAVAVVPAILNGAPPRALGATLADTVVLDGIGVTVSTAYLADQTMVATGPNTSMQVAAKSAFNPYRQLALTAIPIGSQAPTEIAIPQTDSPSTYLSELSTFRSSQGASVSSGPAVQMFGSGWASVTSHVNLDLDGSGAVSTEIIEWVASASNHLWLLRAAWQQTSPAATTTNTGELASLDVELQSPTPTPSSTPSLMRSVSERALPTKSISTTRPRTSTQPQYNGQPSWWSDACDTTNFSSNLDGRNPSHTPAKQLSAGFNGVVTCGPNPFQIAYDLNHLTRQVTYPSQSTPEYEWQCVEFPARYVFLLYGVPAYSTDGKGFVDNFPLGSSYPYVKVANGTPYAFPQAGDIISLYSTSTSGHVAIVTGGFVDANGNGTLLAADQNDNGSGTNTLTVSSWHIKFLGSYDAIDWLHDTSNSGPALTIRDSMQLFAPSVSRSGGAIWNNSYPSGGPWSGFHQLGAVNPYNFNSVPASIVYNQQIEVFAVDSSGVLWNFRWSSGCSGWCAPWQMDPGVLGGGPLSATGGLATAVFSDGGSSDPVGRLQLFVVGTGGVIWAYSCTGSCSQSGWSTPPISLNNSAGAISATSGLTLFAGGASLQLFAVGTDGAVKNYSYSPGSCGGGWCTPWTLPIGWSGQNPGTYVSTASGLAVMPWTWTASPYDLTIQLFAVGVSGTLQMYSWWPAACPTDSQHRGWCGSWSMPLAGLPQLGSASGLSALQYLKTMQVFGIGSNGQIQNYSFTGSCSPGVNGWCNPWQMSLGTLPALNTSSGVAAIPWANTTLQVFAADTQGGVQNYSFDPWHGWYPPWEMQAPGAALTNV